MEILTSGQRRLLQAFGGRDFFRSDFVPTGGTAPAAFYLAHRLSEALHLFTGSDGAAARMKTEFGAMTAEHGFVTTTARSFPTFLDASVQFDQERVAVHLALDTPYRLEQPVERRDVPLRVESALDLAENKPAALYGRASAKDFVDLYFIHHGIIPIPELFPKAARKSPGIEPYWLARAFLQVRQAEVLPRMLKPLTLDRRREFFLAQAEQLMAEGCQS